MPLFVLGLRARKRKVVATDDNGYHNKWLCVCVNVGVFFFRSKIVGIAGFGARCNDTLAAGIITYICGGNFYFHKLRESFLIALMRRYALLPSPLGVRLR